MVIRNSKVLCRHLLQNQHKLKQVVSGQRSFAAAASGGGGPVNLEAVAQKIVEESSKMSMIRSQDLTVRLAEPHMLQKKPEASEMIFGKHFTDHMLKIYYHHHLGGWQKPEITPLEDIPLHPASKVLHYAVELFEGMKAYRGDDGKIRLFRPELNMRRMNQSAKRSALPFFDGDELIKCISRLVNIDQEWVPHQEEASLYIRPTLIGIDPVLGVYYPRSALLFCILCPVSSYFGKGTSSVSLLADPQYARAWPGSCGDSKMGSNYGPTIWPQRIATESNIDQILWLFGDDHQLTEVGTMNIFMAYVNEQGQKILATPPLNGLILPGITRASIIELARKLDGIEVREETFTMPFLINLLKEKRFLELFGAGTAVVVTPVSSITYLGTRYELPTMEVKDPIFEILKKQLTDIQFGRVQHPWAPLVQS